MCPPGFQGPAEDMADDAGGEGAASSKADPLTIPPPSPRKETFYADLSSVRTLFSRLFFLCRICQQLDDRTFRPRIIKYMRGGESMSLLYPNPIYIL